MVWTPEEDGEFLQTQERSFERSCVKALHKIWFPLFPYRSIEKEYGKIDLWSDYSQYISVLDQPTPELTFLREDQSWSLNLHTLLYKPLERLPFYCFWEEQPSDGFVFPLIGKFGIAHYVPAPPDRDCLLRHTRKGKLVCIELLESYAQTLNVEGFLGFERDSYGE